jgi:tetratricopeptide (TPR) repeat protein
MTEKLRARVLRIVEALEGIPAPPGRWILALASIIALRHFLEQLAGERRVLYFLSYFLHYPLAYVAPLLALTVVLAAFARERADKVIRLMLFAWLLTLLPPLIDMFVSRGAATPDLIGYLLPKSGTLWQAFLNLLNPAYHGFQGPTAGIRVEAAGGCLLAALYVHLKTRSALRAVAAFVAVYATMFFFFALPPIALAVARAFGSDVDSVNRLFFEGGSVHRAFAGAPAFALSDLSTALMDLFVVVPLLAIWCRMADRDRFRSIVGLFDPLTAGLHAALVCLGFALARSIILSSVGVPAITHPFDVVSLAGMLASAVLVQPAAAALALVHGGARDLPEETRRRIALDGGVLFVFAALFALCVSYVALAYVLSVFAAYSLYSARPFRLSRVTPVAGLLAGGVAVFLIQLGYSSYAGAAAALWLPKSVTILALVTPLIGFTAREIWAGDESALGVARRLGERRTRLLAAALAALACALPPLVLRSPALAAVFGPAAVVVFLVIVRAGAAPMRRALSGATLALVAVVAVWSTAKHPLLEREVAGTSFAVALRASADSALPRGGEATPAAKALNEGSALLQRGDYGGAAAAFRRAVEEDPEYVPAYLGVGTAYTRLGRTSEAVRAFRRALALDPGSVSARVGIAQTHMLHAQPDSAIAELNRAIATDPRSSDATYTLALVYLDTGDLARETEMLQRTVSIDPGHSAAYARIGDIQLMSGRYAEAIAAFKAALLGRMPVEHVHSKLANAYHALGDMVSAEAEIRKEILLAPKMASPHAILAGLLAEQGRTDDARREFETALSLTKDEELRALFQRQLDALRP